MGNACCVAARDKIVVPDSSAERNNVRHSPTWSFRWDNRGRVAGEDTSHDGFEMKLESAFVSSEESPLNSIRTHTLQKSPASDFSFPTTSSIDTVLEQVKHVSPIAEFSHVSSESFLHSISSSTLKPQHPHHVSKQVSDDQIIYGVNSLSKSSATEERQGTPLRYDSSQSQCGLSEGWSLQPFSEMMLSSRGDEPLSYEKINHHGNRMINHEQQTCGTCFRPLSEKSLWSSEKIFLTNELSVSAILACGHVYHGECLEQMTLKIEKFDPSCPICILGEKKTMKMSEEALNAIHSKRLRDRVLNNDFVMYDHSHMTAAASKSPKLVSSSSAKSSSAKPFLAHFSVGSRSNYKSPKENLPVKKKGFFWTKSSKI